MSAQTEPWDRGSKPMSLSRVELPFKRSFTEAEVELLRRGLIPQSMEDKWFGILRSHSLDFYRSWTGYHIYRLSIRENGGGIDAGPLIVNDDPEQHCRLGDDFDTEMIDRLIDRMLEVPVDT